MKKLNLSFACFIVAIVQSGAQTTLVSENFNTYNGKDSTVPSGWIFSAHGVYTSASFSGPSGPNSFQFGKDSVSLTTPSFSKGDSLSFWIKATSTASNLNRLIVLASDGNNSPDTIAEIDSLPKSGKTISFPLKNTATQVVFLFRKSAGNLAFDDVKIVSNTPTGARLLPPKNEINFAIENVCLHIRSTQPDQKTDVYLFDSSGKILFRRQMKGDWNVDLTGLEPGMYIAGARLNGKNYTKKIVITK